MIAFKTARLAARYFQTTDADALFALCSDLRVMQWVGDGTPLTHEECERWISVSQRNYAIRGFGNFALAERESGEFMGYGGIVYGPDSPDPEIIYALAERRWRQGYASELVPGLLDFAFNHCELKRVIASIAPENVASRRIVERAGMIFRSEALDRDGLPMRIYLATRQP